MSKSQYKELLEFLTDQFAKIEDKFQQIDQRFEQIDSRFQLIDARFDQIEDKLGKIEYRLDKVENRLMSLENNQDSILKEVLGFRQEFMVVNFKLDRIESWIIIASKKLQIPYNI